MIRFVLFLALVACADAPPTAYSPASRPNTAQSGTAQCTTEDAVQFALIAVLETSEAYQDIEEAHISADSAADSAAIAAADSAAYTAYDSIFTSLRITFGTEAAAAYDLYMDIKRASYDTGSTIDTTTLNAVEAGKYLFHSAGVNLPYGIHSLNASEQAIWESEYSAAWDTFEAAGTEATEVATVAAHNAACSTYNNAILALDTRGASVAYRAAILAFSAAYLYTCAQTVPFPPLLRLIFRVSWPLRSGPLTTTS